MYIGRWVASVALALALMTGQATAAFIVDVQPIITAEDDGSNPSTFFGDAGALIKAEIDDVWAQADISVNWFEPVFWHDSFAGHGDPSADTRAPEDFELVLNVEGPAAGVSHPIHRVIDMYFVQRLPGLPYLSDFAAAGLAWVGAPGVMMFVGEELPTFDVGREAVAHVVAHEIGHNLGLDHLDIEGNLMHSDGNLGGSDLTDEQIAIALQSDLIIPEPASAVLLLGASLLLMRRGGRRMRAPA